MVESTGTTTSNGYSRLIAWEVWNFMSIEHAKAEFDESNIVNFKGYNDSGKSTMLRALDVLLYNIKPRMQTAFIQDGKDYCRVMAYFDDGVIILRDKYINGQSLYEVYKGSECIYSTKQGNLLTKVSDVPEVIKQYLGLISYDDMYLNSRSCFDKQLLVQTTGSENYKFLNAVLKSEEIAIASELVNTDKNKVLSDINVTETELSIYRRQTAGVQGVSGEMVSALKSLDKNIDINDSRLSSLGNCDELLKNVNSIPDIPEIEKIDDLRVKSLAKLSQIQHEIDTSVVAPEVTTVSPDRLLALKHITELREELKGVSVPPSILSLDSSRLSLLLQLIRSATELDSISRHISEQDKSLDSLNAECAELEAEMTKLGKNYVKCPNCGTLVEANSGHVD